MERLHAGLYVQPNWWRDGKLWVGPALRTNELRRPSHWCERCPECGRPFKHHEQTKNQAERLTDGEFNGR
jgi:hypothetical protein